MPLTAAARAVPAPRQQNSPRNMLALRVHRESERPKLIRTCDDFVTGRRPLLPRPAARHAIPGFLELDAFATRRASMRSRTATLRSDTSDTRQS